jgi:crotonobetainyl-CoA:carnitine CoA-transferase CaiB-like acyl-CoA transferase
MPTDNLGIPGSRAGSSGQRPLHGALEELLEIRGLPAPAAGEVSFEGHDPFYQAPYHLGESTAAILGGIGIAANDLWEMRTGRRQTASVNLRHAAATLRTVDYTRQRDEAGEFKNIPIPPDMLYMLTATQPWKARDGRWFLPHFNLPHLGRRVLDVLQCDYTPDAVRQAVAGRDSAELDQAIADAMACGSPIRTPAEWAAHPQGQYLAARPAIEITKIADGPAQPLGHGGARPLEGVRVLDLTRILAGPITGRTLAEHGADVLLVTGRNLAQTPEHVRDTGHGKRSVFLDMQDPGDFNRLRELAGDADVFINGFRPGRLQAHGMGLKELAAQRPGLIYVSISCYGSGGPLAGRAGWEQVAQAATGICHTYGEAIGAGQPKLVFAPVCDYTTGYLGALGALLALGRRAREGGSYHVQVSLCQSSMFIQRRGALADFANAPQRLTEDELAELYVEADSGYGRLRTLGPALRMSETQPHWARSTPVPGSDTAQWLPRK